jgi:glutamine amidotransferase
MIAIVKYNAGNIMSVSNAVTRLGYESIITDDRYELMRADKVIFPGVGEAGSAMAYLKNRGLDSIIMTLRQPVLGICLGLQLLCRFTEESDTECLGIFPSDVKLFPPADKIPHMGWNNFITMKGLLCRDIVMYHSYMRIYNTVQRCHAKGQFLCYPVPSGEISRCWRKDT